MKKKTSVPKRNWGLVFISLLLIILGLGVLYVAISYEGIFGWGSLWIGLGGLATMAAAVISIIENDPRWILLGLITPW